MEHLNISRACYTVFNNYYRQNNKGAVISIANGTWLWRKNELTGIDVKGSDEEKWLLHTCKIS